MKNRLTQFTVGQFRKAVLLPAVWLLFIGVLLCGCGGKSGPSENDARKYVEALLDLTCTGTYDKSVTLSDVGKDREIEIRESIIDSLYTSSVEDADLREDVRTQFREFLTKAAQKCRYSVTSVEKTDENEDSGYDVTVSIEPLKAFQGASDILDGEMKKMEDDTGKLIDTDPDEIYSTVFGTLFQTLTDNLDEPEYEPAEEVTVRYQLIDASRELYSVSAEDCRKMGEKLFSLEGLE